MSTRPSTRFVAAPARSLFAAIARAARPVTSLVSPVGRIVAIVGALAWLGGWLLGWNELMLVAAAALLVLVISVVFTFGRATLEMGIELQPQRLVAGESAAGGLTVVNASNRRLLPLRVELPIGAGLARFDVPSLGAHQEHDELFVVPTRKRAVIPVGPASSVRGDPLGLLRKVVPGTPVVSLFVHPQTVGLERLGSGFLRDLEGQTTNDLSNNDVAFHTLRDYVPGDDRRHVHWRSSARLGKLLVRQFVDTRQSHLAVVISGEVADYASEGEFELAVSLGGSLAVRAVLDEQNVSVVAAGRPINTVSGQALLDGLSAVEFGAPDSGLMHGGVQTARLAPDASIVALVTGSVLGLKELRGAAARLPADARVLVIRACPGSSSSFRPVGPMTLLDVASLAELPKVLWAVTNR